MLKDQRGAAILLSMIVISAVILIIALSIGTSSIAENQINLYQSKSNRILLNTDGCAQEALTQLNRNSIYTGETLTIDETSCIISIDGSGSTRTVSVAATNDNYTKNLQINVTIYPTFSVTSWSETTN